MLTTVVLTVLAATVGAQTVPEIPPDVLQLVFKPTTQSTTTTTESAIPDRLTDTSTSTIVPPLFEAGSSMENVDCIDDDGQKGKCVRYYQCNDNKTINEDGTGLLDLREGGGGCKQYYLVCCLLKRPENNPITPPTVEVRQGCGWRNPNGVGFLTTGDVNNEAKFGEFPWMVSILTLQQNDKSAITYLGGGSLIHPSVVLTAAHVVNSKDPSQLLLRVGEWDTRTESEIYSYQERGVKEVIIHKDYNDGNLFYDIALVILSSPVNIADKSPHVGLACLPPSRERARTAERCFSSGWGKKNYTDRTLYASILKKVELPVVDRNTCQNKLRQTRLGNYFQLHTSFMCAGGEAGRDTCQGDGGSPLVCPSEFDADRYIQYGIVAWGIGCGADGTPGVYVDVSNLRDWIDDKVIGQRFDINTYTYK